MKHLLLLLTLLLAVPALAQERPDRSLDPETSLELSAEDQARLDAFLANRPRTVVAARPADSPRRTPQPPTYDRGAIVFTVDSAYDDGVDSNPGDGVCSGPYGECQLRSAIAEANAQPDNQPVRIEFGITTGPTGSQVAPGVWRITLTYDEDGGSFTDALPVFHSLDLTIDGLTQPGASCGDLVAGVQHDLRVIIDGNNLFNGNGLVSSSIPSPVSRVFRGLVIQNFDIGFGILANHPNSVVECNYLGSDHTGTIAAGNRTGVRANVIRNNLISGNGDGAVSSSFFGDTGLIEGNLVGTDASGLVALGNSLTNGGRGINIPSNNDIVVRNNVVSANGRSGISIGGYATGTMLYGNLIGLSRTGQSLGLGNAGLGILIHGGASDNDIGLPGEAPNYVADNASNGIRVEDPSSYGTDDNRVQNNIVGLDASGNPAPNDLDGISLFDGARTVVRGNTVSGNTAGGILLFHAVTDAVIEDNLVGLGTDGDTPRGNGVNGIAVLGTTGTTLRGNTVSDNGPAGILLSGGASEVVLTGNRIGTTADGTGDRGNAGDGLVCQSASDVMIGGTTGGQGNTIAFNGSGFSDGIFLRESCTNAAVLRNSIHTNAGLGIDYCPSLPGCDDVTPNDSPDADGITNYPVITSATNDGTNAVVTVTLSALPNQPYRIELFRSSSADPSGYGEGATFISNRSVTTNGSGTATTTFTRPASDLTVSTWAAVTATVKNGTVFEGTSEFSEAVQVVAPAPPLAVTITPTSPVPPVVLQRGDFVFFDVTFEVGATGPSSFAFWTEAVLPNGNVRSPLIGPNTVNVTPPTVVTLSFGQRVPNVAPFGSYTYRVEAGTFPGTVLDQDSFAAQVVTGREGDSAGPDDWQAFDAEGALLDEPQVYDFRTEGLEAEASSRSDGALPSKMTLEGAYPNPFSRSATVSFAVPSAQRVRLAVYDVLGREVARLVDGEQEAGRHEATLDGAGWRSGVYLVRLVADGVTQTQRLTLVR